MCLGPTYIRFINISEPHHPDARFKKLNVLLTGYDELIEAYRLNGQVIYHATQSSFTVHIVSIYHSCVYDIVIRYTI